MVWTCENVEESLFFVGFLTPNPITGDRATSYILDSDNTRYMSDFGFLFLRKPGSVNELLAQTISIVDLH